MLDCSSITGFEWDEGNSTKSETKHAVTRTEVEEVFVNAPLVVREDITHSKAEARWHALGCTNIGRLLHVTFTVRKNLLRPISARPMNRKERAIYEKSE